MRGTPFGTRAVVFSPFGVETSRLEQRGKQSRGRSNVDTAAIAQKRGNPVPVAPKFRPEDSLRLAIVAEFFMVAALIEPHDFFRRRCRVAVVLSTSSAGHKAVFLGRHCSAGQTDRTSFTAHGTRSRCSIQDHPLSLDRKSTRLNSSHLVISYAVFCL